MGVACKTFHVIVYGCQMNYSDSARIKAVLQNCGRVHVDNETEADVVIIDTCSVRQKSEDKIRWKLREMRKDQKVWLTGCMIQHNLNLKKLGTTKSKKLNVGNFVGTVETKEPILIGFEDPKESSVLKHIAKNLALRVSDDTKDIVYVNHAFNPLFRQMHAIFPQVELFFRINDTWFLPYFMRKLGYEVSHDIEVVNEYMGIIPHDANMLMQSDSRSAFVPISSGCSQFCAYCIVPYARGLEKNRPREEILKEVQSQLDVWAQEITLLGQIVNKHPEFATILREVSDMAGVKRLRYTSPYPTYYSDEIFALHEERANICPHIHMPLQSWSNAVLKKMFRGYTKEQYISFVDAIRALKRPISITTDIIVWFSGETEEDFLESLELVKYARFDMIYIGIYSPRPWTYGAKHYVDDIPMEIKKERRNRLNDELTRISYENNQQEIGTVREIIVREIQDNAIIGYSDNMKNVVVKLPAGASNISGEQGMQGVTVGTYQRVKIVDAESFKIFGELV